VSASSCLAGIADELDRFVDVTGLGAWIESPSGVVMAGAANGPPRHRIELTADGVLAGEVCVSAGHPRAEALGTYLRDRFVERLDHETELADFVQTIAWQWKQLNFLLYISQAVEPTQTIAEACRVILARITRLLGSERASVLLTGGDGALEVVATWGHDGEAPWVEPHDGVCGWVRTHGTALVANSPADLPAGVDPAGIFPLLSLPFISAPLASGEDVLGVLNLCGKRSPGPFMAEDQKLVQTAASVVTMAVRNARLVSASNEAQKLRREMETAAAIQALLLPRENPSIPGLDIFGSYHPASVVGGDYFDFVPGAPGTLYYAIADISGHGLHSAMFMSNARSLTRALLASAPEPGELCVSLNHRLVSDAGDSGMFVTGIFGRYDIARHRTVLANCGHVLPVVVRAGGAVETPDAGGPPLAMITGFTTDEIALDLAPGDLLFLCTDGLFEAQNDSGEMFGMERTVAALVERHAAPLPMIAATLLERVAVFRGAVALADDVTLVFIRRTAA
jgi:serine phosphatase RsbU (regulator of sigma subunit)